MRVPVPRKIISLGRPGAGCLPRLGPIVQHRRAASPAARTGLSDAALSAEGSPPDQPRQFQPPGFPDSRGQSVFDGAGRDCAGARKQHRYRDPTVWSAAVSRGPSPRAGGRQSEGSQHRHCSRPAEREPGRHQRQQHQPLLGHRRQLQRGNHGLVRVGHPQLGSLGLAVRQPGPLHLSGEQPRCGPNQLPGPGIAIVQPRL